MNCAASRGSLVTLISLSLIVIFQPELRRLLGYLGQPGFIRKTFSTAGTFREAEENDVDVIKEIIEAVKYLTKTKTGALIVIEDTVMLSEYERTGILVDAVLTYQLLINIFEKNTNNFDDIFLFEE